MPSRLVGPGINNAKELAEVIALTVRETSDGLSRPMLRELVLRADVGRRMVPEEGPRANGLEAMLNSAVWRAHRAGWVVADDERVRAGRVFPIKQRQQMRAGSGRAVTEQMVIDQIAKGRHLPSQIAKALGVNRTTVDRRIREMFAEGKLEWTGENHTRRRWYLPGELERPNQVEDLLTRNHALFPTTNVEFSRAIGQRDASRMLKRWIDDGRLRRTQRLRNQRHEFVYHLTDQEIGAQTTKGESS